MGGDLGTVTLAALGIAVSPMPFLLAVVLLGSRGAIHSAAAFVAGETLAVGGIAAAAVFLVADDDGAGGSVGVSLATLEIAIGVGFAILLAVHLGRPRGSATTAAWWSRLDRVGTWAAFAGGLAMVVVNPKNLALTLAGAAAIVHLGYSPGWELASVVTFTVVAMSVLFTLLVLAVAFPGSAAAVLDRARRFVLERERVLVTVALGILAAFFVARGLVGVAA